MTLLLTSNVDERPWFSMHTDNGPFLLCAWHRPPVQGEMQSILDFNEEFAQLRGHALGTLLVDDLNLHSERWLVHSSSNSAEGELMRDLCLQEGLR